MSNRPWASRLPGWGLLCITLVLLCWPLAAQIDMPGCPKHLIDPADGFGFLCFDCDKPMLFNRYIPVGATCVLRPTSNLTDSCRENVYWTKFTCARDNRFYLDPSGVMSDYFSAVNCVVSWSAASNRPSLDCDGSGLPRLQKLTSLPYGGAPADLEHLRVRHHRVMDIAFVDTYGLANLTSFDVSNNRITELGVGAFSYLMRLSHLNLSSNRLTVVTPRDLPMLQNLQTLDLSSNPLQTIRTDLLLAPMHADCTSIRLPSACGPVPGCHALLPGPPAASTRATTEALSTSTTVVGATTSVVTSNTTAASSTPAFAQDCHVVSHASHWPCAAAHGQEPTSLPFHQLCDGHVDCADASDEQQCEQLWDTTGIDVLDDCTGSRFHASWRYGVFFGRPLDEMAVYPCLYVSHLPYTVFVADVFVLIDDNVPQWRGPYIAVAQAVVDFYLTRHRLLANGTAFGHEIGIDLKLDNLQLPFPSTAFSTLMPATTARIAVQSSSGSNLLSLAVILPIVVGLCALILGLIYERRRRLQRRLLTQQLGEQSNDLLEARLMQALRASGAADGNHTDVLAKLQAYELDAASVVVDGPTLHRGNFGIVRRGLICATHEDIVAKCQATGLSQAAILLETTMLMLAQSPNVVGLKGFLRNGDLGLMLCLEYCAGGNLLQVLRGSRATSSLSPRHLLQASLQTARALQYLSHLGMIHRDVAARNILVRSVSDHGLQAALGDFGHARLVGRDSTPSINQQSSGLGSTVSTVQESSPDEYYRQASLIETAARWQPPEVLAQSLFTLASDAWSFGVLLYEIWTLGQVPYGDLVREADVVAAILQNGRRLPVPPRLAELPDRVSKMYQRLQEDVAPRRPGWQAVLREHTLALQTLTYPDPHVNSEA